VAGLLLTSSVVAQTRGPDFPDIPLPPPIEGLIGMPQPYTAGRKAHLDFIRREAEQAGLPPDVADAVAQIESGYNPSAVGGVGEAGLMQIRPTTAAMLGYRGTLNGLFEPETNIHYGVSYLARAWQLAGGDLCRALMKYRAGHGEERMTPLSVEYCRRVRTHLATIGSPLGAGADAGHVGAAGTPKTFKPAPAETVSGLKSASPMKVTRMAHAKAIPVLPPHRPTEGLRTAAVGPMKISPGEAHSLAMMQEKARVRKMKIRQMWAAHEARLQSISAKLRPGSLRIATGI
jgi:hypothetical protein